VVFAIIYGFLLTPYFYHDAFMDAPDLKAGVDLDTSQASLL